MVTIELKAWVFLTASLMLLPSVGWQLPSTYCLRFYNQPCFRDIVHLQPLEVRCIDYWVF